MEPISDVELEAMGQAGASLQSSPAWDVAVREIERRMQGVVTATLLGKLENYEQYLEKRAEYHALTAMKQMPDSLVEQGASNE